MPSPQVDEIRGVKALDYHQDGAVRNKQIVIIIAAVAACGVK